MFTLHTDCALQHIWISSHHYIAHNLQKPNLYSATMSLKNASDDSRYRTGPKADAIHPPFWFWHKSLYPIWQMLETGTPLFLCKYSTLVKMVCFGGAVSLCPPPLLISLPPAALRIPAGQWLACCYVIPSLWVSTKAAKLLRNMFWAAKGLRSFVPSLYPALLTNSWPWSNDLCQASGLWDTKMLLFLPLPFSI